MARVVIACDKFKGSLTAAQVSEHLAAGIRAVDGDIQVASVLVADGGDGTLDAAVAAGFERVPIRVTGPTGEPVTTAWARRQGIGEHAPLLGLVEMADACGLLRLPSGTLAGLTASSRGVGEAMVAALDAGVDQLVVGVGGSASTDGGAGMLQALGARLLDADGRDVGPGVVPLGQVASIDLSGLHPRLADVPLTLATDVDNPLLGEQGAPAIFGPQKGLGPDDVARADAALARLADAFTAATGRDDRDTPGAGAAGGVGWALLMLGATRRPGVALVLELAGFDELVRGADLVVTGEGSIDRQTLLGKTPAGVAWAASQAGVPVIGVCGRTMLPPERVREIGIERLYALSDLEPDPQVSMRDAGPLLERLGSTIARDHLT